MLNPFPGLLDPLQSTFYIPLILRVVVAVYFVYIAQYLGREEKKLAGVAVPVVGRMRGWMVWFSVAVTTIVACCLFVGFETQWAAVIGMFVLLKHFIGTKNYQTYLPFTRATYVLLFIICATLLISGAGAMAFDLPL